MRAALVVLCCSLALTTSIVAQQTTGTVAGRITDTAGGTLSGVAVELRGRGAMHGALTDTRGEFVFRQVLPGDGYAVAATLSGFGPVEVLDIHVFLGQRATVSVQMMSATSEEITVTSAPPLIDKTTTNSGLNVTEREFDTLPTTRSFQTLTAMVPGVSLEVGDRDRTYASSPSVGVAGPSENNYIIDGLSTTDAFTGLSGTNLTMNFIQEVQVLTGGYSAEFGRATGGVFNVVTKSGTNDLHGDAFAYYQNADWSANNIRRQFFGTSTRANGIDSADVGLSAGGPIRRDAVWFFAAYDPTRKTTHTREFVDRSGGFVDEQHEWDSRTDFFATKLTWLTTPSGQLVLSLFGDRTTDDGWLGGARAAEPVAMRREDGGGVNGIVHYSHTIGDNTIIESRAGRHTSHDNIWPTTELGLTVPRQWDDIQGRNYGGLYYTQVEDKTSDAFGIKGARHGARLDISVGADREKNEDASQYRDHSFVFYGQEEIDDVIGVKDFLMETLYSADTAIHNTNDAVFGEVSWRPVPAVQINTGVRYEKQTLDAPRGVLVAAGITDGALKTVRRSDFSVPATWAPRLGIVFSPGNQAKLFAYFGRYVESIPLFFNYLTMDLADLDRRYYYSVKDHDPGSWVNPTGSPLDTGDWTQFGAELINQRQSAIDANLKSQYEDELSLGGEFAVGANWRVGSRIVERRMKRAIEDFGVLYDPARPAVPGGFIVGNPGQGVGSNVWSPKRDYRALELTAGRRQTGGWYVQSSFVYARARGNYEGLYMSTTNGLAPNWTPQFDVPAFRQNVDGRLPADRPFALKVHAARTFSSGLTVSEAFQLTAGAPVSALGPERPNGYGDGMIFLLPRGSYGRTPTQYTLDVHGDYPIRVGAKSAVRLIADVFNATNHHAATVVDNYYIYRGMPGYALWRDPSNLDPYGNPKYNASLPHSQYFNTPQVYQSPRTMQVGVKFTY